ncbi:MAG: 4Fe-4S dicluster domain-containing protein [Planctomycetaceae bacterium]|nr:4Fe-4S dicluster domain-containing protein [Planctomycetaceae bacterium]
MAVTASLPVLNDSATGENAAGIPYERFLDCVHCGLCTSACPTYLETGDENDSPRGRIYLMRAVTDGRIDLTPRVTRHLELCLDCRSCETACPSGVQYGRLIEPFRAAMATGEIASTQAAAAPRPTGWFERYILHGLFPYPDKLRRSLILARWVQRLRLDRLADAIGLTRLLPQKLQRMHRLLPRLESPLPPLPEILPPLNVNGTPSQAPPRARVMLFTGCVADAMFRHTHWATARVLQVNGCEVHVPRSQVCCGAIHYHSGAADPAVELARQNARAVPENVDAVIVNVAGCGSMLKDYDHIAAECGADDVTHASLGRFADKVRDVSEFLAALGPVQPTHAVNVTATYHDACHLCHAQQVREQPRRLLEMIPGLKLVPLAESEICCGAAGSYNLTEPEMADRLGARKAANIRRTGAEAVVTANAGCSLQIQALLRGGEGSIPVLHPVDLLARGYLGDDWRRGVGAG